MPGCRALPVEPQRELFGICPPIEIITPIGASRSVMSSTRSSESSSKVQPVADIVVGAHGLGLWFIITPRQPVARAVSSAFTLHQSNSTLLPILYAPEPRTTTDFPSRGKETSCSVPL